MVLSRKRWLVVVAVVMVMSANLVTLGALVLLRPVLAGGDEPKAAGLPQIRTSFGTVRVDAVEIISGVSEDGHDHSTSGLHGGDGLAVAAGEDLVRVALTIRNSADRRIAYSPDRVVLQIGAKEESGRLAGASTDAGRLPPRSQVSVSVSFASPDDLAGLQLAYRNEDGGLTEAIDLDAELVDDYRVDYPPGAQLETGEHSHDDERSQP